MKKLMRTFALMAAAALGLSACTGEKLVPDNGNADGKFVTVHFGAEAAIEGATKATLTPEDEKTFKSAWENGDVLSVGYSNDNKPVNKGIVPATWTADHFETKLPEYNGMWAYKVVYPAPDAEGVVDFGSARTQKGNAYNSNYDLMKGSAIVENADAGKTADGKNIVFNMTRQTAIAYFHLTSTLDEEVVSAKLSVADGHIASSLVMVSETEYSKGFDLSVEDLNEITITFEEGTAPKASNFQLWYNVLPTTYTKMTLTVETTGHTLTISRTAEDMYLDGKLYKVVKAIPADKWVKKGGETPSTKDFTLVTSALSDWTGSYLLVGEYSTETTPQSSYYAFDESVYVDNTWGKCSEVVVDNNTIASTYGTMALEIVPGTTANTYSILTPSGKYLSASAVKKFNLSETYSADNCDFAISFGANNQIVIEQASGLTLETPKHRQIRYNHNDSKGGFRWYDSKISDGIYLYKGPSIAKYSVSCGTVEGGSFFASPRRAEAGAEVILMATPEEGYAFNNDWSVKGADETVIEVVDGKFVMPAQNVTISGTFSKVIPLPTCATPVITIAEDGVVSITCETAGATIHYTVGDAPADPTEADAVFGAVTLTDGQTIKAIAVAEGFKPSAVASKKYTVGGAEAVLVWDDDFSSNTKASTTALKSLNGSKTGFKDAYTTVENCYPEVSSIKLSSGRTIGSIQTPKFTRLSGTSSVTVTIEYAGYGTDKGTLNLSVVGNGKLSVQSLTATSTAKSGADVTTWDKATFVISGADKETALKLTASAKGKRFFINSIKIETN